MRLQRLDLQTSHTESFASKEPHPKVRLQQIHCRDAVSTRRASKEPHPKVRLQPSTQNVTGNFKREGASKEPHPKVRLQQVRHGLPLVNTSLQRSHTRRCGYNSNIRPNSYPRSLASKEPHPKVRLQPTLTTAPYTRTWLQRSHTRRCGYNRSWDIFGSGLSRRFKGATPEGAVTTCLLVNCAAKSKLQRSHTRRCGYNNYTRQQWRRSLTASKEPHPKVRLQLMRLGSNQWAISCFKGATPEGAVTTSAVTFAPYCIEQETPQCFKGATPEGAVTTCVRGGAIASKLSLQRSHTRRCGYNYRRGLGL